jgi:hypothetical protein
MAARKMRVDHSVTGYVVWRDVVSGEMLLECNIGKPTGDPTLDAVIRYGVTQIVQDGGAVSADASFGDKLRGMKERIAAIEGGTYRLGQRGGMVDADVFTAMVALGMVKDNPDNRAKWREAKKSQRDAIRRKPAVAQWIAENATDADAAAGAVDAIFS